MTPQLTLEAAMLVCFGLAWPLANLRMLRTRRASGNAATVALVFCGYLAGMASKLAGLGEHAALAPLFWLYLLNGASVAFNLVLLWHYGRRPPVPAPAPAVTAVSA